MLFTEKMTLKQYHKFFIVGKLCSSLVFSYETEPILVNKSVGRAITLVTKN